MSAAGPTVHAWRVHSFEAGAQPTLDLLPMPEPGPGEVRVRVLASAISFVDLLLASGGYQWKPPTPFVPGSEFSGVVDALGTGDTLGLRVGDRVCGVRQGAWTEMLCLPASAALRLGGADEAPTASDWAIEAAALMAPYATALYALRERAHLRAGETLLVLGASGGVGHAAVQLGQVLGARVIAAASNPAKRAAALAAGADAVIDTSDDWKDEAKALAGKPGVNVVFDPVGGEATDTAFRTLGWRGRHLMVGFAGGQIPALKANLAIVKGAALLGVDYRQAGEREPDITRQVQQDVLRLYREGRLRPRLHSSLGLERLAEAAALVRQRDTLGRVVLDFRA
jgi:NADPH2:quinone reductase